MQQRLAALLRRWADRLDPLPPPLPDPLVVAVNAPAPALVSPPALVVRNPVPEPELVRVAPVKPYRIERDVDGRIFTLYEGRNRLIRDRMWARVKRDGGYGTYRSHSTDQQDSALKTVVRANSTVAVSPDVTNCPPIPNVPFAGPHTVVRRHGQRRWVLYDGASASEAQAKLTHVKQNEPGDAWLVASGVICEYHGGPS